MDSSGSVRRKASRDSTATHSPRSAPSTGSRRRKSTTYSRHDRATTSSPPQADLSDSIPRVRLCSRIVPWADARDRGKAVNVLREGHDGTVWAGADEGLFRLDRSGNPASLRSVEIGIPRIETGVAGIQAVLEDRRGSLWVGARGAGLFRRWPDGTFARYTTDHLPGDSIEAIFESREGHLWVGTRVDGFFRVSTDDTHRPPTVALHFKSELPTSFVSQFLETSDGRFWIATAGGLIMFSSEATIAGRQFQVFSTRNGLPASRTNALVEDIGGNLWVGTLWRGAARFQRPDDVRRTGRTSRHQCALRGSHRTAVLSRRSGRQLFRESIGVRGRTGPAGERRSDKRCPPAGVLRWTAVQCLLPWCNPRPRLA